MLVLTRMRGQEVYLTVAGVQIKVEVAEIRGDKIRLGFTAPDEVSIQRREVYEAAELSKSRKENRDRSND